VNKKRASRAGGNALRVYEMARHEANREATRVPWQRLLDAREQYVEWNAFSLWVRAIVEAEHEVPSWLSKIIEGRCPGFGECKKEHCKASPKHGAVLWRRLSEWIDDNVFGHARREGWMRAVTFYAARDPAFLRDCAYSQHCERQWKRHRPQLYPSLEEWRRSSEQCSDEVLDAFEMREEKREIIKASRAVSPRRLAEAVAQYMDWEAFTYWLRSLLEADTDLPDAVIREVQRRCPGFWECDKELRKTLLQEDYTRRWKALLEWGENRFFAEARQDGWFDALVFWARAHPRSVRTVDYWVFYWDENWSTRPVEAYPSFHEWRRTADNYVVRPEEE